MSRDRRRARHRGLSAGRGNGASATGRGSAGGRVHVPAVERANRLLLPLFGLLLVGVGAAVLLAGCGVFGASLADRPVLGPGARSFAALHGWFWPVVGTALGLLAVGAAGWLSAQFRGGRLRGLYVMDDELGGVRVDMLALSDAVADDLVGNPVVRAARVVVRGRPRRPVLRITVEADAGVDARELRSDIDERVLPRARRSLGRPDLAAELELGVYAGAAARVR